LPPAQSSDEESISLAEIDPFDPPVVEASFELERLVKSTKPTTPTAAAIPATMRQSIEADGVRRGVGVGTGVGFTGGDWKMG
jgi:hypothetical protein